jgi:hypothetical protein
MTDDLFDWADRDAAKLEAAFWTFHLANPLVYELLVKYARQWGRTNEHGSINALFERVRWDFRTSIQPTDKFRLNNNHRAFYARLIESQEPDIRRGFFRLRQQRRQASFGPLNADLPSGDHVA